VRQGQQNRRGRGRNNNRKGGHHNPLSRSFESNGPDVKIRGTPAHIAEKYFSLARDAQSSGDPVLEQNYLQHAEHYTRIIMAYREQLNQPGDGMNGAGPRGRGPGEMGEGFDDLGDDQDMAGDDGFQQPFMAPQAAQPQPSHHQPRPQGGSEHGRQERHEQRHDQRQDRPFRRDRDQNRPRFTERGERHGFVDRERHQGEPQERQERQERAPEQVAETAAEPRPPRRDRFQQAHEQPEFLRRPVRRARSSDNGDTGKGDTGKGDAGKGEAGSE
jgi:hypothetical protein